MKTKEEIIEKRKNLKTHINDLFYSNEELDIKQTEWLCEIFKRKCLKEDEFTHGMIKIVKDNDYQTHYDIIYYNNETIVSQGPLYYVSARKGLNEIDNYVNKKYPFPKKKKTHKKIY